MNGFFGLPMNQAQDAQAQALYGPAPARDPIISALMAQIGNNAPHQQGAAGLGSSISPQALAALAQGNQSNPLTGQVANALGLAGNGAPYQGGIYNSVPSIAQSTPQNSGMGFYPGF